MKNVIFTKAEIAEIKKGTLKVSRTNKGRIFVEIDYLNGRPPQPLSYVVFPDTSHDGKECEYETNDKGIFLTIKVDGREVWTPRSTGGAPSVAKWHPLNTGWYNVARVKGYPRQVFVWAEEVAGMEVFPIPDSDFRTGLPNVLYHIQDGVLSPTRFRFESQARAWRDNIISTGLEYLSLGENEVEEVIPDISDWDVDAE